MTAPYFLIAFLVLCALAFFAIKWLLLASRRETYIRNFSFPAGLFVKLRMQHPQLSLKDCQLVAQGLRQYFFTHLNSKRQYVSMPSQVADDLWHEFILNTKSYQTFCQQAFGQFFHHTPAAALGKGALQSNAGLRRCWWYACRDENINPHKPTRLPLLFALDTKLNIVNGFLYAVDCETLRRQGHNGQDSIIHCGGDFSSSSIDGGVDGWESSHSSSDHSSSHDSGWFGGGDSSSDSGGGSSCGGGGCGGGGD